jgi:hypothetical protein
MAVEEAVTDTEATRPALTPASRKAVAHYRAQAARLRKIAANKRARAADLDEVTRDTLMRHAADIEADADRWDALADELEALGDTDSHHEGQGELL